ncbi:MAG: single-stranded-DNA-specific exonuclease RecJ [Faecalibacterium sp.]
MTYRTWTLKEVDRSIVRELSRAIAQQDTDAREMEAAMDPSAPPWTDAKRTAVYHAEQKENALLAGILAARGVTDPTRALTLLAGEEELSDPMLMADMSAACQRILKAVDNGETIVVFGDYDVDGVTATALLYQHLKGMGASVKCMLPSRDGDGYGLSKAAIQTVYNKGYQLIVTVDNGISAVEEAEFAASLGIDLIVTDHHLPPEILPRAVAVVDPRRADDGSPFKGLCGAGVAFKLCAALDGCSPEEMIEYCGDLAAVGTVADVMPLTGENRTLVKAGLRQLQQTDRPGIGALLEEVGLAGKSITAENVSYALAPRINAAGRMDNAVTALQLILCEDEVRAAELAHKLSEINQARQEIESQIVRAAQEQLDQDPSLLEDRVVLLWGRDWHPGVIGIVASRLVERVGRPVIVVSVDASGEGKGSGRSVQGFNLHSCIAACSDLLIRFGGHAMAAGLSVREENLPALRRCLNGWAARECPVLRIPPLQCDLSLRLDRITVESVRRLERLAPYGVENPTPVFLLQQAILEGVYPVSEGKHSRLRLRQGSAVLYAVWFGMHPAQIPYAVGDTVDAALNLSVYDAVRGPQLSGRILELHPAGLGNETAEQAALVQALRRGAPLTPEQKQTICPTRSDIITVYRELRSRRWHADDLQPLFAKLGAEQTGKILVSVTALEQVGLIAAVERDGARCWEMVPSKDKKNLADAPILKCLEGM